MTDVQELLTQIEQDELARQQADAKAFDALVRRVAAGGEIKKREIAELTPERRQELAGRVETQKRRNADAQTLAGAATLESEQRAADEAWSKIYDEHAETERAFQVEQNKRRVGEEGRADRRRQIGLAHDRLVSTSPAELLADFRAAQESVRQSQLAAGSANNRLTAAQETLKNAEIANIRNVGAGTPNAVACEQRAQQAVVEAERGVAESEAVYQAAVEKANELKEGLLLL